MTQKYVAPEKGLKSFHCPYCQVFANQRWASIYHDLWANHEFMKMYDVARCDHCTGFSMWHQGNLIIPSTSIAPMPVADMPADVRTDYEEARSVFSQSPRSSAALLRLAVQKLCADLGGSGNNLNEDIGILVKKGLPTEVQQALDVVRVIGNNQVHPGVLDLRDDPETAAALFGLINLTVEIMITRPKQVQALFNKLPATAQQQIQKRDTKTP